MNTKVLLTVIFGALTVVACSEQASEATVSNADQVVDGAASAVTEVVSAAPEAAATTETMAPSEAVAEVAAAAADVAELQPETIGTVETLPEKYPPEWILVQDGAFFNMFDGKVAVVDASSDDSARRFKGMFNAALIGQFVQAKSKPEMYVAETFLSRGSRGERTDVLTIYDKRTLSPIGEVVIPPKRSSNMPTEYNLQLADDEKLALVYNFTPAASVTVVDLEKREMLGEVPIPGCALAYPMAGRGFSTVCGDGTMLSVKIGADAESSSSNRTESFFDFENDPLMEKATQIGNTTYFPTFLANIYPIDMSGDVAVPGEPWSMLGAGDEGWRPGGIQLSGADAAGNLYVLMHPEGYDGSHKDPGVEVWVFDVEKQQRIKRVKLELPAITMGVTQGENPLIITTNINLAVDVHDVNSGAYLRTLNDIGVQTAFMLHGAK